MEKWFTAELAKLMMILGIGTFILSALLSRLIARIRGGFKPFRKDTLWYLLLAIIVFALLACLGYPSLFRRSIVLFIFLQACMTAAGILHIYFMYKYLKWTGDNKSFWLELLFTVIIVAAGGLCFILLFRFWNRNGMEYIIATGSIFFIIPLLVYKTYLGAIAMPPKIFRQWYYPVHEEIAEPDDSKLKNLLIISFEFQKQTDDRHYTNFRAKAPVDMEFGQLFYYFINDYNERHPNNRIQYLNNIGTPFGWIFYKKPKWHTIFTQYIGTDSTIFMNNIRENDIIVCNRSLPVTNNL